jgi:hypothetical protein
MVLTGTMSPSVASAATIARLASKCQKGMMGDLRIGPCDSGVAGRVSYKVENDYQPLVDT